VQCASQTFNPLSHGRGGRPTVAGVDPVLATFELAQASRVSECRRLAEAERLPARLRVTATGALAATAALAWWAKAAASELTEPKTVGPGLSLSSERASLAQLPSAFSFAFALPRWPIQGVLEFK